MLPAAPPLAVSPPAAATLLGATLFDGPAASGDVVVASGRFATRVGLGNG